MIQIVNLGFNNAVDVIKDKESVFIRIGSWNQYERTRTANAVIRIMNSDYGADIYEDNGEMYVSIPRRANI